uniref:Uncharacterized protein n=1 Tax=Chromera velia CCMP2878 TaxID=1169474 RepID=A0A0G4HL65_9ALVE|eukprot:Cvel_28661.t1-p1 / transcript=Cvel_28661.t1 / gene=Cvel_28661 / organism=Chromera_velia_CCMP2878 / gene_product=hypothetical protein / transcript_product=hypothetical protein / location=Cvel_scaffold3793:12556-13745(-) / protein_length=128 / sequence_SO=supercontig / SO=protein_coding / is_pseudo=false
MWVYGCVGVGVGVWGYGGVGVGVWVSGRGCGGGCGCGGVGVGVTIGSLLHVLDAETGVILVDLKIDEDTAEALFGQKGDPEEAPVIEISVFSVEPVLAIRKGGGAAVEAAVVRVDREKSTCMIATSDG